MNIRAAATGIKRVFAHAMRNRALEAAALAALCLACAAAQAADDVRHDIRIEAQPIGAALKALADQTGLQVLVLSQDAGDKRSPAVQGKLTNEEALAIILRNSGLTYQRIDDKTVAIRSSASLSGSVATGQDGRHTMEGSLIQLARQDQSASPAGTEPQAATRQNAPGELDKLKLDEITVTATKREERVMDVPLSIAVVSADDIDRRGLVNAEDYLRGIPGVNQAAEHWGQSIVIRGIESSPSFQNAASGATVATYFGETSTTNSAGLGGGTNIDIKLVDIERVEVLRGPQGTAFGNASLGGAVRTIPVAPKLDRFEGKVGASYSVTAGTGSDNTMIQAIGNVPLISNKLAIRASAYQFNDSGYYRNRAGSDAAFQALAAIPYGAEAFARNEDDVGATKATGGRISALFQATDDLKFTLTYLTQKSEVDGFAIANSGTFDQSVLGAAPEHVLRGQRAGLFDSDIDIANATAEYDLGWGNLLATYSYLDSGATFVYPITINGPSLPWPLSGLGQGAHRENSGEVRLVTRLEGAWNFIAGVHVEDLDDRYPFQYLWHGSDASNFLGPDRLVGVSLDVRNLKQKAAFGEVSWRFLPRFTLTGGVRAYQYDRTVNVTTGGTLFGVGTSNLDADASGSSFRGNLSYKIGEDALAYASWSQGFRLGKPQAGLLPGVCDTNNDGIVDGTGNLTIEQTKRLESDEVDNYEIGGKLTALDRRLMVTADVYRIDWTGLPVLTYAPLPPAGCGQNYNANAGAARSEGVELQVNYYLTRALRVDAGGSWMRARLSKDAPALNAPEGSRLPGAPRVNANFAMQYEFQIAGHEAFVRADSIYIGKFFGNLQESVDTESGGYVKVDATARVQIRKLNVDLFVRNLTNMDEFTFRSVLGGGPFYGYRPRPRTIGLQLGYQFD